MVLMLKIKFSCRLIFRGHTKQPMNSLKNLSKFKIMLLMTVSNTFGELIIQTSFGIIFLNNFEISPCLEEVLWKIYWDVIFQEADEDDFKKCLESWKYELIIIKNYYFVWTRSKIKLYMKYKTWKLISTYYFIKYLWPYFQADTRRINAWESGIWIVSRNIWQLFLPIFVLQPQAGRLIIH